MNEPKNHMFSLHDAAIAYANSAERILGGNADFLNSNPHVVPIFVSFLFQSLEISIKHAGIESGLFTKREARAHQNRNGHGIKELAALAVEKLGGEPFDPIISAMTAREIQGRNAGVLRRMICGDALAQTRESYATRRLGYGEVYEGDFAIIYPVLAWVESVKQVASELPTTIDVLRQWKESKSSSKHFAIFY